MLGFFNVFPSANFVSLFFSLALIIVATALPALVFAVVGRKATFTPNIENVRQTRYTEARDAAHTARRAAYATAANTADYDAADATYAAAAANAYRTFVSTAARGI